MKQKQDINIQEILNYNFTKDLNLEALPQDEQDQFNENLFGNLIERIIKKTVEDFNVAEQEKVLKM
jgi:hypothetical protein